MELTPAQAAWMDIGMTVAHANLVLKDALSALLEHLATFARQTTGVNNNPMLSGLALFAELVALIAMITHLATNVTTTTSPYQLTARTVVSAELSKLTVWDLMKISCVNAPIVNGLTGQPIVNFLFANASTTSTVKTLE